jgi:hypothetical protein
MNSAPNVDDHKYRRIFGPQEDESLRLLVQQFGTNDWAWIASHMTDRTPRQCRERWKTYLCPDVNVAPWTEPEDRLLMEKYAEFGSRWSDFRPFFENRTVNGIKNRWHTLARRARLAQLETKVQGEADPAEVFHVARLLNHHVSAKPE